MSNALFLSSRWINDAVVTASSVQGSLSADYVQVMDPAQVWRATGCAAEYLDFAFDGAVAANALVIVGHNLSALATLRLRLAATAADVTAAPAVDTTALSAWPSSGKHGALDWPYEFSLLTWSNSTAYGFGRLDIEDPTNPDGFVQAGRLFCGPGFVPSANVDNTPRLGLISPDEAARTPFGRSIGDSRGPAARAMEVTFSHLDEDEMGDELLELQRYCGLARDFAFCLDPEAMTRFHRYSGQFRIAALNAVQAIPFWNADNNQVWQATIPLEEVT